nr:unnamed protein product [Callosobruchus analis]
MDGWQLEQNEGFENGKYIIKKEQKVLQSEQEDTTDVVFTFEYHVAFNISYGVPVLCFNVWKQDGTILTIEEFWKTNKRFEDSSMYDTLTQMDHPVLRRPFLTLHPCKTHEVMEPFLERRYNSISKHHLYFLTSRFAFQQESRGILAHSCWTFRTLGLD